MGGPGDCRGSSQPASGGVAGGLLSSRGGRPVEGGAFSHIENRQWQQAVLQVVHRVIMGEAGQPGTRGGPLVLPMDCMAADTHTTARKPADRDQYPWRDGWLTKPTHTGAGGGEGVQQVWRSPGGHRSREVWGPGALQHATAGGRRLAAKLPPRCLSQRPAPSWLDFIHHAQQTKRPDEPSHDPAQVATPVRPNHASTDLPSPTEKL
jgi:hypothetical protein